MTALPRRAHLSTPVPPGDSSPAARRSQQLLDAFTAGGYETAVSLPQPHAAEPPDVLLWATPAGRAAPLPGSRTVHVVDLAGALHPQGGPAQRLAARQVILQACRGAHIVLVESAAAHGFWSAELSRAGVAAVPVLLPPAPRRASRISPAAVRTLLAHCTATASTATINRLAQAAAWAGRSGAVFQIRVQSGASDPAFLHAIAALERQHGAQVRREGGTESGGLLLDLRDDVEEERIAAPLPVLDALAQGRPVLSCVDGPLTHALVAAGAGALARPDALDAALDRLAALPPAALEAMGTAAASFLPEPAAQALLDAVDAALAGMAGQAAAWRAGGTGPLPLGPGGHLLVISDEGQNLLDLRIHLPFGALHRRGTIGGYTILRHDGIAFSTRPPGTAPSFDGIWVHRSVDPAIEAALQWLGRPFVYDMDDSLLASPRYRPAFQQEGIETAHGLIRACAALSCSTARLAALVHQEVGFGVLNRAVITANLGHGEPMPRRAGPPCAVVWASSDVPALTESRREVERAVRDFCQARRLRLVCLGVRPPGLLAEAGFPVEHVGLLPYNAYLDYLRSLSPAILVCPLETTADPVTQRFVDGKSDVKIIEALLTGLTGVFSDAAPYRDSTLPPPILCGNTYAEWMAGLERAHETCTSPGPVPAWPESRDMAGLGLLPWVAALHAAPLATPLHLAELADRLAYVRRRDHSVRLEADAFDEAFYLDMHPDVRGAVKQGEVASGFEHYQQSGFRERRTARARRSEAGDARAWWASVLHEADRLEASIEDRDAGIEALRTRIAVRRSLARGTE